MDEVIENTAVNNEIRAVPHRRKRKAIKVLTSTRKLGRLTAIMKRKLKKKNKVRKINVKYFKTAKNTRIKKLTKKAKQRVAADGDDQTKLLNRIRKGISESLGRLRAMKREVKESLQIINFKLSEAKALEKKYKKRDKKPRGSVVNRPVRVPLVESVAEVVPVVPPPRNESENASSAPSAPSAGIVSLTYSSLQDCIKYPIDSRVSAMFVNEHLHSCAEPPMTDYEWPESPPQNRKFKDRMEKRLYDMSEEARLLRQQKTEARLRRREQREEAAYIKVLIDKATEPGLSNSYYVDDLFRYFNLCTLALPGDITELREHSPSYPIIQKQINYLKEHGKIVWRNGKPTYVPDKPDTPSPPPPDTTTDHDLFEPVESPDLDNAGDTLDDINMHNEVESTGMRFVSQPFNLHDYLEYYGSNSVDRLMARCHLSGTHATGSPLSEGTSYRYISKSRKRTNFSTKRSSKYLIAIKKRRVEEDSDSDESFLNCRLSKQKQTKRLLCKNRRRM